MNTKLADGKKETAGRQVAEAESSQPVGTCCLEHVLFGHNSYISHATRQLQQAWKNLKQLTLWLWYAERLVCRLARRLLVCCWTLEGAGIDSNMVASS